MPKKTITRDYYEKLNEARYTLCGYCEADLCEKCIVTSLMDSAENELPDDDDEDEDDPE